MIIDNILVFPCGTEIGLEIYRCFQGVKNVRLFGASSVDDHGRFVFKNYTGGLPSVYDKLLFLKAIIKVVKNNNIQYIYPAHDDALIILKKFEKKIGCKVISSPLKTCLIARSKSLTYKTLRNIVNVPMVYSSLDFKNIKFPVFLKPDASQGSRGVIKASNLHQLNFYLKECPELIILEYLPGDEFTIDCFTDFRSNLRYVGSRIRQRIRNGISVRTMPVKDTALEAMAEKINKKLKFRGAWFFQTKKDEHGKHKLLEIAPRIAGAMGINRAMGVNLALLGYYDCKKIKVEIYNQEFSVIFDRALYNAFSLKIRYSHVYIDFDDCLIIDKKLNSKLIYFLAQCRNRGVKIYVLSRHIKDLNHSLAEYGIAGLIDNVISIIDQSPKSKYIKHKNSIFIDDSYKERAEVLLNKNIPVFALDAIESLINHTEI